MTTHEEKKKRIKKLRGIQWLMSAAGVIIIAWGLWDIVRLPTRTDLLETV